jgi:hypothetical protein
VWAAAAPNEALLGTCHLGGCVSEGGNMVVSWQLRTHRCVVPTVVLVLYSACGVVSVMA